MVVETHRLRDFRMLFDLFVDPFLHLICIPEEKSGTDVEWLGKGGVVVVAFRVEASVNSASRQSG